MNVYLWRKIFAGPKQIIKSDLNNTFTSNEILKDRRRENFYLTKPPFRAAEEGSAFPVGDDLVEEPHLTFDVRDKAADAKSEENCFLGLLFL